MSTNLRSKLRSNEAVRAPLSDFYAEFCDQIKKDFKLSDSAFHSGWSTGSAGALQHSRKLTESVRLATSIVLDLLDTKYGDEREIEKTIFYVAHRSVEANSAIKLFIKDVLDALADTVFRSFSVFVPSYSVTLADGVDSFELGDARLLTSKAAVIELNKCGESPDDGSVDFVLSDDSRRIIADLGQSSVMVPSNSFMWCAKVESSAANADSEAEFLIDVTTSLISLLISQASAFPRRAGDIVSHPTSSHEFEGHGFAKTGKDTRLFGARRAYQKHVITDTAIKDYSNSEQATIVRLVHDGAKGAVAESVKTAMAWHAKGTQSTDPAFRLLYFFTAIEALLSRSSSDPVSETIARFGSTLISSDVSRRSLNAFSIKKLYHFRSQTVHRGSRETRWPEARAAQNFLELSLKRILNSKTLSLTRLRFLKELNDASYGRELNL